VEKTSEGHDLDQSNDRDPDFTDSDDESADEEMHRTNPQKAPFAVVIPKQTINRRQYEPLQPSIHTLIGPKIITLEEFKKPIKERLLIIFEEAMTSLEARH